jgi:hypothetical protein
MSTMSNARWLRRIMGVATATAILVAAWAAPAAADDPVKPQPPASERRTEVGERPKVPPVPGSPSTAATPKVLQSPGRATSDGLQAQAVVDSSQWPIANYTGNGCIVARGGANDAPVVKTPCNLAFIDQYWRFVDVGGGYYEVRNGSSGKCLVVRGGAYNTPAIQYTCAGYLDQHWIVIEDTTGRYFMLQNRNSGMCLVMRSSENNARQVTCDQQYVDQWWLRGMPTAPARTNDLAKPVYFVHGYTHNGAGFNANDSYWSTYIADFASDGVPSLYSGLIARKWTFCYYSTDTNCDVRVPGDRYRSIKAVGADLAWEIFHRYSKFNVAVDAVGHSMGGLVIRAAITGVQRGDPAFPPYLYVEDAVTLATPHRGSPFALICQFTQCVDMRDGSAFQNWLYQNPQGWSGTDWTFIGFEDDRTVWAASAVPNNIWVAHKIIYDAGEVLPTATAHMDLLQHVSGHYNYRWCDSFSTGCNIFDSGTFHQTIAGMDPARMARYGVFYEYGW